MNIKRRTRHHAGVRRDQVKIDLALVQSRDLVVAYEVDLGIERQQSVDDAVNMTRGTARLSSGGWRRAEICDRNLLIGASRAKRP